jgi:hypothetical protein
MVLVNCIFTSTCFSFRLKKENWKPKDTTNFVSKFYKENENCLKCHGQKIYEYTNEGQGTTLRETMCSEKIINRDIFYTSNHKTFKCTDCHSEEYSKFPHSGALRMETIYNCIDCHGNDEKYAKFQFERIEAEYQQSTHFNLEKDGFTCWKCHNPHSYQISIRNSENLTKTIAYDNSICLNCHSNYDHFQLLSDRDEINIIQKHEWLPNQAAHFQSVRCIECHTKTSDSILVAHMIMPKDSAVRKCNECHSQNSILMASLYKFKSKERRKDGFFNGVILNESYVIGANRNEYLNNLSLIIFVLVIGVIGVHVFFRSIKVKSKSDES